MKNTMKEQEIKGNKWSLLFYYPLGKKKLHAQIYDNKTEDVIEEEIIKNQTDYDFVIDFFTTADANWSKNNLVVS